MPVIFSITYHALWPFDCRYVCVRTQAAHDLQKAGSPQFVLEDMDFGRRCGAGFSGIWFRYWGFLVALAPPLPIARLLPCTGTPWKKRFARPATMCHRQTRCLTRAATSCWCPASWHQGAHCPSAQKCDACYISAVCNMCYMSHSRLLACRIISLLRRSPSMPIHSCSCTVPTTTCRHSPI
jgi:hypothetical protein